MLIGLSVNHKDETSCVNNAYVNAVIKAGGSPVLIPLCTAPGVLKEILSSLDALIMTGGGDLFASFFGEELHPSVTEYDIARDKYDIELIRLAVDMRLPILGICRGMQVLNVALGGTILQDIPSQVPASQVRHNQQEPKHRATHPVSIDPDSQLYQILRQLNTDVNSIHHQAVKELPEELRPVAWSEDGVIEALESADGKMILGVQWHPEHLSMAGEPLSDAIFSHLVKEADLYKKAKEIHRKIITVDSHCDTPMFFPYNIDIGKDNNQQVNYPKMQAGMLDAVFMVAYLKQGKRDDLSLQQATQQAIAILNELHEQINRNADKMAQARMPKELLLNKHNGKKSIFFGVENGYAIGKDLRNLALFKEMGVTYITLCHNGDNDICDSAVGKGEHNGLSNFGKEVVREMNRLGIVVDISHTSEKTSFDVLEISDKPVIASHSSVKALCDHPRNLSDELMQAIARKGGVIQVCLYKGFIKKGGTATLKDAVDHIDYIVKNVGIDYVGIGSDFDGGGGLVGLKHAGEYLQLTMELIRRGYTEKEIAKIWGENLMRVLAYE